MQPVPPSAGPSHSPSIPAYSRPSTPPLVLSTAGDSYDAFVPGISSNHAPFMLIAAMASRRQWAVPIPPVQDDGLSVATSSSASPASGRSVLSSPHSSPAASVPSSAPASQANIPTRSASPPSPLPPPANNPSQSSQSSQSHREWRAGQNGRRDSRNGTDPRIQQSLGNVPSTSSSSSSHLSTPPHGPPSSSQQFSETSRFPPLADVSVG